jgi:hypothetical protein
MTSNLSIRGLGHFDVYNTSLASYIEMKQAEANKSIRLPLLDRQLMGPLFQCDYAWSQRKKEPGKRRSAGTVRAQLS